MFSLKHSGPAMKFLQLGRKVAIIDSTDQKPHLLRVLFLFVAAHLVHHLVTALGVPLLPFIRDEFGLDYTKAGLLISAFTVSYGVGQLGCGWLADFIGRRKMLFVGLAGPALAGLAIGFSQSYLMLAGLMVFMGLSGGGYHPSASPLISAMVPEKHLGRALGVHVVGGSASFFMAPLLGVAIAASFGWRGSFIGLAVPTLAVRVHVQPPPARHRNAPGRRPPRPRPRLRPRNPRPRAGFPAW